MENTKIGNKEAIALLVTITFNNIIMSITKTVVDTTASASFLNVLYIGIISIIFTSTICYFLNKFPTFDLVDISEYLGGKILKTIIGILYIGYFIFFAGNLLHIFSSCLKIIYFEHVKIIHIALFFVIGTIISCIMRHNAIYRSTFIVFPLVIISTLFLLISNSQYIVVEKMYPILGKGLFTTFITGLSNMFAFQGLAYIFFIPPVLKEPNETKKIAITSIIFSCIFLLISVVIVLLMFDGFVETDELLPLYSAAKYIEYGSFFQKLDSAFVLIWILSFISYLSITLNFSSKILRKITNIQNENVFIFILGLALFFAGTWQKNYAISTFFANIVYKYAFFILVIGISTLILISATIKQKIRKWFK